MTEPEQTDEILGSAHAERMAAKMPAGDEAAPDGLRDMRRHLTTLTATVDQLAAEQSRTLEALTALAFALGMLAGMVAMQHKQIKGLARALAS